MYSAVVVTYATYLDIEWGRIEAQTTFPHCPSAPVEGGRIETQAISFYEWFAVPVKWGRIEAQTISFL